MKTLTQTILPRIALYKALLAEGFNEEETNNHMRRYMMDIVAEQKHASTAKMESIPGFYFLYSKIFLKVVRKTDLWESEQAQSNIKRITWNASNCSNFSCNLLLVLGKNRLAKLL